MNRADEVFALFMDANPVVDPTAVADRPRLELLPSLEGSVDMQTEERPTPIRPSSEPPGGRRWLIPALTAAAVLVVAIVIGVAVFGGGEDSPVDVVGPTDPAPAAAPLEVATTWIERFESGDVAGYEALIAPDATFACLECSYGELDETGLYFPTRNDQEGTDSRILGASSGSLNATCTESAPTVSCDIRVTSEFGFVGDDGQPANEYTAKLTFTVEGGLITHYEHHAGTGNWFDYGQIKAYETWLAAENPAAHEDLFFFGTMLTSEQSQFERHRELVAQWVAAR